MKKTKKKNKTKSEAKHYIVLCMRVWIVGLEMDSKACDNDCFILCKSIHVVIHICTIWQNSDNASDQISNKSNMYKMRHL